jgi:hypothetical protein
LLSSWSCSAFFLDHVEYQQDYPSLTAAAQAVASSLVWVGDCAPLGCVGRGRWRQPTGAKFGEACRDQTVSGSASAVDLQDHQDELAD